MRSDYGAFVAARERSWDAFETGLRALGGRRRIGYAELEALALAYRQVLQDHAVAVARFPRTGAQARLQRLAAAGTRALRHDQAGAFTGPLAFFTRVFPAAFRRTVPCVAVTAALFAATTALGFVLAWQQPGTGTVFVGEGAVQGLREGRLWTEALTTAVPPAMSSSGIATNNMSVALAGWAGGALAGAGTVYVVTLNGLMLGAVIALTGHFGLTPRLLEFIAAHGPLEISLILITAGAGLSMGLAVVAPDDRPRRDALAAAGRDAVAVLGGCLPWFLLLGFVEGYVSPDPQVDVATKIVLGLALQAAFLLFAWRPGLRAGH